MLKEKIQENITSALKSKDTQTLSTLRFLMNSIKNTEIEKKGIDDSGVIQVMKKQIKELEAAKEMFEKANRQELVTNNVEQIAILSKYLPAEISDEELKAGIQQLIEQNKEQYDKNPKMLMGICVNALKSKADPQRIVKMLQEL